MRRTNTARRYSKSMDLALFYVYVSLLLSFSLFPSLPSSRLPPLSLSQSSPPLSFLSPVSLPSLATHYFKIKVAIFSPRHQQRIIIRQDTPL